MYWRDAIQAEMDSIDAHDTYTEIKIPSYVNPKQMLTLRWVFKRKTKADGTLDKYKARLCVQGFKQKYGVDYNKVYSPTLKHHTLRALLTIAAHEDLDLCHWDASLLYGLFIKTIIPSNEFDALNDDEDVNIVVEAELVD